MRFLAGIVLLPSAGKVVAHYARASAQSPVTALLSKASGCIRNAWVDHHYVSPHRVGGRNGTKIYIPSDLGAKMSHVGVAGAHHAAHRGGRRHLSPRGIARW